MSTVRGQGPSADLAERFEAERAHLAERMQTGDMSALFHQIQLNVVTATKDALSDVVRDAYDGIGQMPLAGTEQSAFTGRSAHLIVASDLLIRRVRLPGIVFRFDQDPDAIENLNAIPHAEGGSMFGSSTDWYYNMIGVVHYFGPLLGCLSPRFWCVPATRTMSVVLFNLGRDLIGFHRTPVEPMQLIPTTSRNVVVPQVRAESAAYRQAIHWWVVRLNQMFEYLADPTTFKDSNGLYAAHEHHHWMLTFGEVFGLTTSLQCAGRDVATQRALMNSLLDIFADRIIDADFDRLCTWSYAKKRADDVRQKMPAAVATLLMPAADRAINALADMQNGFFIQRQRRDEKVRLRQPDGSWEERSPERAVALLLKLFRNATHGFGHRKGAKKNSELDASLLVHHDGRIPSDIVMLPYLYLLDVMCNPKLIKANISRKVALPD